MFYLINYFKLDKINIFENVGNFILIIILFYTLLFNFIKMHNMNCIIYEIKTKFKVQKLKLSGNYKKKKKKTVLEINCTIQYLYT